MKILLATSEAVPKGGGIASYAQELLQVIGPENDVLLLTDCDEQEVPGFRETWTNYKQNIYSYDYSLKLVEKINRCGFDLVINSNSKFVSVCAPFLHAPIVSISHFVNGILAVTAGYNSGYLSRIVCLSHYGKEFIRKRFSLKDSTKLSVVYNSVQNKTETFDSSKVHRKRPIVVFPGGCALHKSPDVVVQVLCRLLETDLDFQWYWLGSLRIPFRRFSVCKEVSALVKNDPRVIFTGKIPREEAVGIIESANIFLLPSRGEGCPISMLEAMCTGCIPIVSDARHGSREILEAGKFGIITPQGDADQLYEAVCRVLAHPEEYQADYQKTFDYSKQELCQARWKEQMMEIMHQAVAQKKRYKDCSKMEFLRSALGYRFCFFVESYRIKFRDLFYCMKFNYLYLSKRP